MEVLEGAPSAVVGRRQTMTLLSMLPDTSIESSGDLLKAPPKDTRRARERVHEVYGLPSEKRNKESEYVCRSRVHT